MRTLGVEIKGSDTLLVILDGTAEDCKIELLSTSRLQFPKADPEQVDCLISLQRQIRDIMKSERVDHVGVIRADNGCSPLRAKVECVVQLAAKEISIPCTLVAAQTVAAAEKRKVGERAGPTLAEAFQKVDPAYLKKAVPGAPCLAAVARHGCLHATTDTSPAAYASALQKQRRPDGRLKTLSQAERLGSHLTTEVSLWFDSMSSPNAPS